MRGFSYISRSDKDFVQVKNIPSLLNMYRNSIISRHIQCNVRVQKPLRSLDIVVQNLSITPVLLQKTNLNNNIVFSVQDSSGKRLATQKHLVKESPDMLAIGWWTGQVPRRPPLPAGTSLAQLMAVGSRRNTATVVWMLAKSDTEMR